VVRIVPDASNKRLVFFFSGPRSHLLDLAILKYFFRKDNVYSTRQKQPISQGSVMSSLITAFADFIFQKQIEGIITKI
jgi:hypothetical protein